MTCLIYRVLSGTGQKGWSYSIYANFQEKVFPIISWKIIQTFYWSTTMKSLEHFPRNLCEEFFLKIGIHSAKMYLKISQPKHRSMWLHASHCRALQFCSHLFIFVNKITIFVFLALEYNCLKVKKRNGCINKKVGRYGLNWSKVCAVTCENKELCPAHEEHPSEPLHGEFHFQIAWQWALLSCGIQWCKG